MLKRRTFLKLGTGMLATPYLARGAFAAAPGAPLPIPPLAETGTDATTLTAAYGKSAFLDGVDTASWGFSQSFLGPTLRMTRGQAARMRVENRLEFPVTCHWHGLHVPGNVDGGPHLSIAPGEVWEPVLEIDQPAATHWYHSHSHGVTAEQVYGGLAGMIQIVDPDEDESVSLDHGVKAELPSEYGVDDIPLILQDRAFSDAGQLYYVKRGPALMHGFRGDTMLVNGAVRPEASVPAKRVRLRLLNGSNARIYHLRFSDGRSFHQVASDGGLLPAPVKRSALTLAPAERAEIVVDFEPGAAPVSLWSGPDMNDPMAGNMMFGGGGGMMGGMLPGLPEQAVDAPDFHFEIMRFVPYLHSNMVQPVLPDRFTSAPMPDFGDPLRTRRFELSMHGGGMGGMGMMGGMTINGQSMDMDRIDHRMQAGETELWQVVSDEMAHPFHVHGTQFQVISHNGAAVDAAQTGLKDTFLVNGQAEFLVRIRRMADAATPYMYHCHILEHEDAGMMGQFTVA